MSKFVIVAVLLAFIVCFAAIADAAPEGLTANGVIQKIIGEYNSKFKGPSHVNPEGRAHVIDADDFHL